MIIAFLIGLFSALHCFGMCGGLVGAMTMSLTPAIRQQTTRLFFFTLAYNSGRILSYMLAGALIGGFGQSIRELLLPEQGLGVLRLLSSFLVIAMGLYLAGWFPQFARIEKIGAPLWRQLQPLGQKLLPVKTPVQAFLFGAVWGWLPCGLVYYALLMAPAREGASDAALFMLFFGLGTLLPMMSAGFLTGRLVKFRQSTAIRYISGSLLILMGMISVWLAMNPDLHHHLHYHIL